MLNKLIKNESGQTIIEAVVALAAVFIIVAAVTIAIVTAISNSQFIKNQNLANKYAQQGMEYIRRIQAEDIDGFSLLEGTYSYTANPETLVPGESTVVNIEDTHIRNIILSDDEAPCNNTSNPGDPNIGLKKVTVQVRWSSGRCDSDNRFCHDSTIVSCLKYQRDPNVLP